jgi:hypothetical protein
MMPLKERVVLYLLIFLFWPILVPAIWLGIVPPVSRREKLREEVADFFGQVSREQEVWNVPFMDVAHPRQLAKAEKQLQRGREALCKTNPYARYVFGKVKPTFREAVLLTY